MPVPSLLGPAAASISAIAAFSLNADISSSFGPSFLEIKAPYHMESGDRHGMLHYIINNPLPLFYLSAPPALIPSFPHFTSISSCLCFTEHINGPRKERGGRVISTRNLDPSRGRRFCWHFPSYRVWFQKRRHLVYTMHLRQRWRRWSAGICRQGKQSTRRKRFGGSWLGLLLG